MSKKVVVQLNGGIGNQLFQFYAAQYLAIKQNKELIIDDSSLKWEPANIERSRLGFHQNGLRGLVKDFTFQRKQESRLFFIANRLLRKLLISTGFVYEFNFYFKNLSDLIRLSEVQSQKTIILKGSFNLQSSTIVNDALSLGAKKVVLDKSKESGNSDHQPIVVHVRLTDYVVSNQADTAGALPWSNLIPTDYYEQGINLAIKEFPNSPLWLFSDDPESALKYIPEQFRHKITFVNDPKKNSDLDDLKLMSQGCAYIIPNSTFGFWAASLSKSLLVICPRPWFKGYPNPSDNIYFDFPKDWVQLDW